MMMKKKSGGEVYECFLHEEDPSKALTFINLTITDASQAVFKMVHEKIQSKQARLPGPAKLKKKVADGLAKTASTKIPPKVIAAKLSEKLPKMLMYKMSHEAGMKVAAQTVFVEEGFVVLQVQVQQVDLNKLIQSIRSKEQDNGDEQDGDDDDESVATAVLDEWIEEQKQLLNEEEESPFVTTANNLVTHNTGSEENWKDKVAGCLEWLISRFLPVTVHRCLEQDKLPGLVQTKLSESMQAMMEKKLADKSLVAETAVLGHEAQARYFFPQLQRVRGKEAPSAAG